MRLLLIRHAESQHNAKETEHLDSMLTQKGRMQAIEMVAFLKRTFDMSEWKGLVSPFLRTLQTARAIYDHADVPFDVDFRLAEYQNQSSGYNCNSFEIPARKDKFPEFFQNVGVNSWVHRTEDEELLLRRMLNFTEYLQAAHPDDNLILVSHAMPIYAMVHILSGITMIPKWDRKICNTSVTYYNNGKFKWVGKFVNTGNDPRGDGPIIGYL